MARGQLNSRGDANDRESFSSCLGISEGIPGGSGSTSSMEMGRDPITFGCSRVEGEPVALLVSSRPTSLSRTTARPEQDVGVPERDHVGRRGFGEPSAGDTMAYAANVETIGRGGADASWNSTMLSHHRRCSSAPNFLSSWRGAGLPSLSSGVLAPRLRDHTIPEGRRFEAVEPPLQSTIAPARPRSWGVGSTARAWCVGPVDFGTRELLNSGPMDLAPKVRASYFVNVRGGQGEMPTTSRSTSVNGLMSQSSTIAGMTATDSRPFEEIKRMRLSQALESGGGSGGPQQQHQDAFGMLRLTPSPTYSTSGRGPHFDTARLAQRFSPGKGVKVSGFPASSLNGRSAAFGGGPGGVVFGPLSPALTEPPTPPSHWKFQEPEAFPTNAGDADGGSGHAQAAQQAAAESSSSQQGVLPMEKRPIDEVSAVQALMSVGLGKGATSLTSVDEEPAACPAAAAVGGVPQQAGVHGCSSATVTSVDIGAFKAARSPLPSLERLKPFEGGCDDDDDGLDKDLWVVVEKGSMCASSDCVYRDPIARIASRRHYHAKCAHTHNGGEKKGMVFHHHQLEKVQKHQRSHKREATKSAPYKRTTPEDHQAMEAAGVEGYRPADWSPEETRQLDELVNQLVAPVTHAWPSIARFFPTKTSIQCLLHWRFTLNDNGIIRGNGTWGAEEDERLRKLAPVFSSPSTGPRWAKIAEVMPGRTAKQCRERYNNHVDPGIKKDKIWSAEEDALVMQLHAEHHNQFAKIARSIPGRCYDDVKNRFNLLVKRRLAGKSPSSGPAGPANKSPRPEVEHSKTGGRSPPTFECTATAGLLRNHPGGAAQTPGASPGGM